MPEERTEPVIGEALPDGDVIRVLLEQHARIRDLFDEVECPSGRQRQEAFEELRGLLAVHEAGEQIVLRPISRASTGPEAADARNAEEKGVLEALQRLEDLDARDQRFDDEFAALRQRVDRYLEAEEREEFPRVREHVDAGARRRMGQRLSAVEKVAPTRPDPAESGRPASEQWLVEPFSTFVHRVREVLSRNP